jgi:uncharacterized protein
LFLDLFEKLRAGGVPVSLTEYLALLDALSRDVAGRDLESFYFLARASLVKDERLYDRFDRIFGAHFHGIEQVFETLLAEIPVEWLAHTMEMDLSEEEKRQIEALGGWEKLMETLRERLEEQKQAHAGGNRMIGTGGTSPFGARGYNPEGIRIGQDRSRHQRAVKVWDRREFRNLDDDVELGTRNIKLALRSLRRFARQGASDELDLEGTIGGTARNGGLLDVHMVPERHNAVKVLLFLDVGGSMERHVRQCEELFSAARSEFRHLEHFYFHNCVYEGVWRNNRRRYTEVTPTLDVLHKYGPDHKLVFVGDASMSPYEVMLPGGSVEHWNEEPGSAWLARLLSTWGHAAWLNPVAEQYWDYTASIAMVRELLGGRMFPLTLAGLTRAIESLKHPAPLH